LNDSPRGVRIILADDNAYGALRAALVIS